ncbi:MAG: iron-containing alcohol dehydrogenase [Lentisphaerae bacterium]|nr:iron-containing alcohol dehydrogenase [Lentisphaerota bacterium]
MALELHAVLQAAERALDLAHDRGLRIPCSVVFESGAYGHLGRYLTPLSPAGPILVVAGRFARDPALRAFIEDQFCGHEVRSVHYAPVAGEPTCETIGAHAALARRIRPQLVLGVGGGSSIDSAKAVAALLTNDGPVEDYLEGLGRERRLECSPALCVAVPTTAGTGAEMTRNAVVACPRRRFKRSLRDDRMVPSLALIDPDLTLALPAEPTAAGGMDAITQLIEACISAKRRPETTELAESVLSLPLGALPRCIEDPSDRASRAAMSLAASASGICLANAGLAMAHGIAAALGAWHGMPHGLACGILLPHTLRHNRGACPDAMASALAAFLGEDAPRGDTIDRGIDAVDRLNVRIGIPPDLRHLRLSPAQLDTLAEASLGSSMQGNPVPMTAESTRTFLASIA